MTIKGYFRLIAILLIVGLWGLTDAVCPKVADAGTIWQEFTNTTLTGYVADYNEAQEEDAISLFENIAIYEPADETMFGIPMKIARHRLVMQGDKVIVDDLLLIGNVGDSDSFYLSYRDDSGGVLYNVTQHWFEGLPPVLVGAYLGSGGKLGASIYGEWVIADGYIIDVDLMVTRNKFGIEDKTQYLTNGKISGKHNFKPDGSVYGEVFTMFIDNKLLYGGGIGYAW